MYLTILILPLLGSFVSGFLGRKIGVTGSHIITCTCLILSSILATIGFNVIGNEKFSSKIRKLTSKERIGPHNIDIISLIIGSILGDSHLEKRKNGIGTRVIFEQSNRNVEYLM